MATKWTEEQQKVISLRDRNILVSAAAGSGKTAVLVQRILSKIMDQDRPVDIDRLLIMTFTRAAAGEMKERITAALEQALCEDPDNEHLQRQMTLVHTAQITTIDGFCSYIIGNYFHMADLDPGYRIAEEGELKLLREDVLKELLEDAYDQADPKFLNFVEAYADVKNDDKLRTMIQKLYDSAMSNPFPEEWLESCLESYYVDTLEEMRESSWMKLIWKNAQESVKSGLRLMEGAREICHLEDGPLFYEEALDSDLLKWREVEKAVAAHDFDAVHACTSGYKFKALSRKKGKTEDEDLRNQAKAFREQEKKLLEDLTRNYFSQSSEDVLRLLKYCREPVEMLVELTKKFSELFTAKKREKNLIDFADMEHLALKILVEKKEDGTLSPTEAAKEMSLRYDEVMVDEYQDSNYVQELITEMVSGWANQRKNVFMVGDVKQSIYRFRLARPEIFMEKYHRYSLEDAAEQRIDLHKNFRSRPQVLSSVNYIFRQIMGADLGGIDYDDSNALYAGAAFPAEPEAGAFQTEVLLIEKSKEDMVGKWAGRTSQEMEALAVAQRICRMVEEEQILDKKTGEYRPVQYGDIAVLLRAASGWADAFSQVFDSKGIPSYTASQTGYFSAQEIVTLLNYLRVCDNPLQDIPLAGVLHSPIVGCTAQEMAMLRAEFPEGRLYESLKSYIEDGQMELFADPEKEALKDKLRDFDEKLQKMRDKAAFTPIHELILEVLKETGFGDYVKALPGGAQRGANVHMLIEKAMDYEKTSYRGLFNFVRYIENLQKYEVDYGEVNLADAQGGSVQIMTIHKSKGLEYPIVFVCGMGKKFNLMDTTIPPLFHPDLGIGVDAVLPEQRLQVETPFRRAIGNELVLESISEELRVLYVALTRAREKLIITGGVSDGEKALKNAAIHKQDPEALLSLGTRSSARTFLDFLLPALARHPSMKPLFVEMGDFAGQNLICEEEHAEFKIVRLNEMDLVQAEILDQVQELAESENLKNWDAEKIYDEELHGILEERFGFAYAYDYLADLPVKVSVSELKKRAHMDEQEKEEALFYEPDIIPLIPRFMGGEPEEYQGAARGTAYHRVMECLDYARVQTEEEIQKQIRELVEKKKLSEEEAACVREKDILRFSESDLGNRMGDAAKSRLLYREQPFVMKREMKEVNPDWKGDETVLVQGIIDAFFEEEDALVLVDYKTDKVRRGQEQTLIERYHTQLEDYADALERMTKKKVKECYIYSFTLGKAIRL